MSDAPQGQGWWLASDGRWYPPESHPAAAAPPPPPPAPPLSAPPASAPPAPAVPSGPPAPWGAWAHTPPAAPAVPHALPSWGTDGAPPPIPPPVTPQMFREVAPTGMPSPIPPATTWGEARSVVPSPSPAPRPAVPTGRSDAEAVPRLLARVIDGALVIAMTTIVVVAFGEFSVGGMFRPYASTSSAIGWTLCALGLVFAVYEPTMTAWRGQTVGKWATGLEVELDGAAMSIGRAFRRHAVSVIGRIMWLWSAALFALDPLDDGSFATAVKNASADKLAAASLLVMFIVAALNITVLVATGRSFYDVCGDTRVVDADGGDDAPVRRLLDRF